MLCRDCEHVKSKKVGLISHVYWCHISKRNKKTGEKLGLHLWLNKPHPKCPLRERK